MLGRTYNTWEKICFRIIRGISKEIPFVIQISYTLEVENMSKITLGLKIILTVMVAVALIGIGVFLGKSTHQSVDDKHLIAGTVDEYAEDRQYDEIIENTSIAIPGYEVFEFKSNEIKQDITLYNPKENICYFKIRIILEDGTTIWTSDLLEPGMSFTSINLDKTLGEGTYENVRIKYDCYSLKSLEQLNGADIKVTLLVK